MKASSRIPVHLYVPDGTQTRVDGPEGCLRCPLPAGHQVHNLPDRPPDEREVEMRRMGEHPDPEGDQ